jgi:hypothetical protein
MGVRRATTTTEAQAQSTASKGFKVQQVLVTLLQQPLIDS